MRFRRAVRSAAIIAAVLALPICLSSTASAGRAEPAALSPVVVSEAHHDVSAPLSSIPPAGTPQPQDEEADNTDVPHAPGRALGPDGALQQPLTAPAPGMPSTVANFAGAQNSDNSGGFVFPPDPNGDVGPNDYVQTVNEVFTIFSKTGAKLLGPTPINTLWSGFGGLCQSHNDGDPVVLYDGLADRWLISQFAHASTAVDQCIAISQTNDPTGAWYRYDFPYSTTVLNDYSKFGVWPDAYYMSANQFTLSTSTFHGTGVVAYERARMLQGLSARAIYFDLGANSSTSGFSSWLPADLDGSTPPPAGAPNHYLTIQGTSLGDPADRLQQWDFHVDWATPTNSSFTQKAVLPVAAFNANLCNFARACISQAGTTAKIDALSDRLMFRNAYRNFGTYEAEVVNHTVNVGSNRAGIRWYEIRNTSTTPTLFEQGTYAGDTANTESRWLGSAALDQNGDVALGYSDSSGAVFPSIRYVGRVVGDPLGTLPQGEATLIAGGGSQTVGFNRWGDYSMLSVDPVDGCTFWYTQEYYAVSGSNWQTRIGSFKFPSCGVSSAPTTPLLDSFNRANGGAGASWSLIRPTAFAGMNGLGNAAVDSSSTQFAWNYWNPASFGPDCEAYVTVATHGASDPIRIGARVTNGGTTSQSGYYVTVGSTGAWSIIRIDSGASVTLASGVTQTLASGDKLGIRIVGSVVTALHYTGASGWQQVLSHDISSDSIRYTGAGQLALEFKTSTLDDFGGGTLNAGSRPVNTSPPTISGSATQGQTLTASAGSWTGSPPPTFGFQWQRCDSAGGNCVNIMGATGSNYTLVGADVGSTIVVVVTATNSGGSTPASSAATAVVAGAPANTALPTISGSAAQGQTLTASPGGWTGSPPPTFAYQWQRCDSTGGNCVDIVGATGSTYTLTAADVGSTVAVVVTATNSSGSASASSAATAAVVAGSSLAPTTPVLDDFNRANGGAGANWSLIRSTGFASMNVSGNAAVDSSSTQFAWNYWSSASFGPDCEAYVTVSSHGATDTIRIGARVSSFGTTHQGYYVAVSSTGAWSIIRIDNGISTTLASGVTQALGSGDKLAIRIVGAMITALHYTGGSGWQQVLSYDSSNDTIRYLGASSLAVEFKTSTLDDFGGGTLP